MQNSKIAVIGSGSWATAIVKILLDNGKKVNWWIREQEIINSLKKFNHNPLYLSSVKLKLNNLKLSNDIVFTIKSSQVIILCVPTVYLNDTLKETDTENFKNKIIVSAIKGILPNHNLIVGDYLSKFHKIENKNFAVITGPSHAEEVAREKLTSLTVASTNNNLAEYIAKVFRCRYIKTSVSNDITGTQYVPVLKNIFAIAVGICNGLGYGDNFKAVLISNAIKEIELFLKQISPLERNICDTAYLGDLLVTSYSQFSRNRMFGNMIGKGYSVKSAQHEMKMVAEGYYALNGVYNIKKKHNLKMDIVETVYNILYNEHSAAKEISKLSNKIK